VELKYEQGKKRGGFPKAYEELRPVTFQSTSEHGIHACPACGRFYRHEKTVVAASGDLARVWMLETFVRHSRFEAALFLVLHFETCIRRWASSNEEPDSDWTAPAPAYYTLEDVEKWPASLRDDLASLRPHAEEIVREARAYIDANKDETGAAARLIRELAASGGV
jgi:hypothetical protein